MKGKGAYLLILFSTLINSLFAQQILQVIRGKVIDKESNNFLVGSTITLYKDSVIQSQTTTNHTGDYRITDVPIGIYNLKVTNIGYLPSVVSKVVVNSVKEIVLNIEMEESVPSMKQIEINAIKDQSFELTNASATKFSVDETNRYAGSRGDPARMVSNYAGIQGSDDSRNDIIVRGNSPLGMLWRYEGIDIPNPNHFAIIGNTGGPLSILNNKVLDNSEFFTGAFPAEYGNTVAGAFDLRMRNGNNEKNEFTAQFGLLGTELTAEGPLSQKNSSSYLATYRYSTLKMLEFLKIPIGTDAIPNYQDMALKLNFPIKNGGSISIFSIGGISKINTIVSNYENPEKELYVQKDRDQYFGAGMNVTGISFIKPLTSSTYIKFILAVTFSESYDHDHLVYRDSSTFKVDSIVPKLGYKYIERKVCGNLFVNKKLNTKMALQTGVQINRYSFNMVDSSYNQFTYKFENQLDYKGNTFLVQPYLEYKYRINGELTFTAGIHAQYLTLNKSSSLEPRGSIGWAFSAKQSISLSAGMHSQMQPTYNYFYHFPTSGHYILHNKNMDFTRSNHVVLTYNYFLTNKLKVKAETYYQYLYNVPIEISPSSFSLINQGIGSKRFYPGQLVNKGTGKNYGVELTIEKSFVKSFFFMYTCSIYNSRYKGSDGIERATDFNGTYAMNLLAGKEIKMNEKKSIELGVKATNAGGRRYTPIDESASKIAREDIYIDSLRNSLRFKPYFRLDFRINFKMNCKKIMHEIGFDLVNILNTKNIFSITYSTSSNTVVENYQLGFLPIFYYKLDF